MLLAGGRSTEPAGKGQKALILIEIEIDRVRVAESRDPLDNRLVKSELFPEVSIGDAPVQN